jgi:CDP-diacylglycerol--glycerol-3-phosphate 3-phosphatidyltransferase
MNTANILTVLRLALAFSIIYLLMVKPFDYAYILALALFLIGVLTDYLDGLIARKQAAVTNFGKIMDPISDKLLILFTLFAFTCLNVVSLWIIILIALREVIITSFRLYYLAKGKVLPAKEAGKYKTAVQMTVICFIFSLLIIYRTVMVKPIPDIFLLIIDVAMLGVLGITITSAVKYLTDIRPR